MTLKQIEREAIRIALRRANGHRLNAAKSLGIAKKTIYNKINKFGLR